jgi:hypothetical protein
MKFKIEVSPDQLGSFARCLNIQFNRFCNRLTYENYTDYYNFRQILKKCFDKIFTLDRKPKIKKCSINFCHNEVRTIKLVFTIEDFNLLPPYELVTISEILGQINQIETNNLQRANNRFSGSDLVFRTTDSQFGAKVPEIERELYSLS